MEQEKPQPVTTVTSTVAARRHLSPEFLERRWKPGVSGNPSGKRGSGYAEVLRIAREHSAEAMGRLIELVHSGDERVAFMAAQAILDRAFGKALERAVPDAKKTDSSIEEKRGQVLKILIDALDGVARVAK